MRLFSSSMALPASVGIASSSSSTAKSSGASASACSER
eukprot:CAMPEP_0181540088 /NCGR_PEP_ID=MMETSP1110-20121109/76710_1 /TAXON_ID=174948 /ORGANISM="Symbiodinium sp., Strain CCMP421" /LENGTH=37 /DNA_ID= /DNA_START= /DNA_END= /DNA_ORIENTATION=